MDEPVKEDRSWLPPGTIDVANEAEVLAWASRLCVTASELREIIDEDAGHIPRPREPDGRGPAADKHASRS